MPIAQHGADVARLLGVPRERAHAEAVEERRRGRPSTRCGACSSRRCRARRARRRAARAVPSIDRLPVECTSFTARLVAERDAARSTFGRAHPQPLARVVAPGDLDQRAAAASGSFTSTEQLVGGPELGVDVGEARHAERRQRRRGRLGDAVPAQSGPHGGVVGADDLAVGDSARRRSRGRSHRARAPAGTPGACSPGFLPGTAVGERDDGHDMSCDVHRATDGQGIRSLKRRRAAAEGYGSPPETAGGRRSDRQGRVSGDDDQGQLPELRRRAADRRRPHRPRVRRRRAGFVLLPVPRVHAGGGQGREPAHRRPARVERRAHAGLAAARPSSPSRASARRSRPTTSSTSTSCCRPTPGSPSSPTMSAGSLNPPAR